MEYLWSWRDSVEKRYHFWFLRWIFRSKLNKLVLTRSNMSVCQQCRILTQLIVIVYIMLCWMLYFVWYKSVFLTAHSLLSLHVLNLFLSWILSYQDLHMIAFPGLITSILFLCRITNSILAHFYFFLFILKVTNSY